VYEYYIKTNVLHIIIKGEMIMKGLRENLNLKDLAKSEKRKHNKISEKAHYIMSEKHETPELTDEQILEIAKDFPTLDVKVMISGDISVKSFKDSWIIRDEVRFYSLYHREVSYKFGKEKEKFHIQDVFRDLDYTFASIVSHDEYKVGIRRLSPKQVEEEMIAQ
jgi:hypothetical protein